MNVRVSVFSRLFSKLGFCLLFGCFVLLFQEENRSQFSVHTKNTSTERKTKCETYKTNPTGRVLLLLLLLLLLLIDVVE